MKRNVQSIIYFIISFICAQYYLFASSIEIEDMQCNFRVTPSLYKADKRDPTRSPFKVVKSDPYYYFPPQDKLAFNTVHLEIKKRFYNRAVDGSIKVSIEKEIGTAFIVWSKNINRDYEFYKHPELKNFKGREPLLFTCKHCIHEWPEEEEIENFKLSFHYVNLTTPDCKTLKIKIKKNNTNTKNWHEATEYGFEEDLAFLPIGILLEKGMKKLRNEGEWFPCFKGILENEDIPTEADMRRYGYLTKIIMFGYPYELYNKKYNLPLARFGHCASDPKHKAGKSDSTDFYTDMASIHGSSGSPLWFYEETVSTSESFATSQLGNVGRRVVTKVEPAINIKFAGVLHAGAEDSGDHTVHLGCIIKFTKIISLIKKWEERI